MAAICATVQAVYGQLTCLNACFKLAFLLAQQPCLKCLRRRLACSLSQVWDFCCAAAAQAVTQAATAAEASGSGFAPSEFDHQKPWKQVFFAMHVHQTSKKPWRDSDAWGCSYCGCRFC